MHKFFKEKQFQGRTWPLFLALSECHISECHYN